MKLQIRLQRIAVVTSVVVAILSIIALSAVGFVRCSAYRGTCYAPSYNERAFQHVRLGMRRAEVLTLLGPPLSRERGIMRGVGTIEVWHYTRQRDDHSWWRVRQIYIDCSGRVCGTKSTLYEP